MARPRLAAAPNRLERFKVRVMFRLPDGPVGSGFSTSLGSKSDDR